MSKPPRQEAPKERPSTSPEHVSEVIQQARDALVGLATLVREGFPPADRAPSVAVLPSDVRTVTERNITDPEEALRKAGVVTVQLVEYRNLKQGRGEEERRAA